MTERVWADRYGRVLLAFAFALLAALLSALTPTLAPAQYVPTVISPLRVESDPNDVNLIDGKIDMSGPTLGVPGAPHLIVDKIQNAAPYIGGKAAKSSPGSPRNTSWSAHLGALSPVSTDDTDLSL